MLWDFLSSDQEEGTNSREVPVPVDVDDGDSAVRGAGDALTARIMISANEILKNIDQEEKASYKVFVAGRYNNRWSCEYPGCVETFYFGGAHHCRICGETVCAAHSFTNVPLSTSTLTVLDVVSAVEVPPSQVLASTESFTELPQSLTFLRACSRCVEECKLEESLFISGNIDTSINGSATENLRKKRMIFGGLDTSINGSVPEDSQEKRIPAATTPTGSTTTVDMNFEDLRSMSYGSSKNRSIRQTYRSTGRDGSSTDSLNLPVATGTVCALCCCCFANTSIGTSLNFTATGNPYNIYDCGHNHYMCSCCCSCSFCPKRFSDLGICEPVARSCFHCACESPAHVCCCAYHRICCCSTE